MTSDRIDALINKIDTLKTFSDIEFIANVLASRGLDVEFFCAGGMEAMDKAVDPSFGPLEQTQNLLGFLTLGMTVYVPPLGDPNALVNRFRTLLAGVEVPESARPFVDEVVKVLEEGFTDVP